MPKNNAVDKHFFVVQVDADRLTIDARLTRSRSGFVETKRHRRSRNALGARAISIPARRLTKAEIRAGQEILTHPNWEWLAEIPRPKTRRDCWTAEEALEQMGYDDGKGNGCNSERPCPFVMCKWHVCTDINPETGTFKLNFPNTPVWELRVTCTLDVAEAGGDTLEGVGNDMNLTRERVRQIEVRGLLSMKAAGVDTEKLALALKVKDRIREEEE